jgi:hypothetical protein
MYVCMYVCMYVSFCRQLQFLCCFVCVGIIMHICACKFVCMCACIYLCVHACMHSCMYKFMCVCVCVCVRMYIYNMNVCRYVCEYVYIHTHIHSTKQRHLTNKQSSQTIHKYIYTYIHTHIHSTKQRHLKGKQSSRTIPQKKNILLMCTHSLSSHKQTQPTDYSPHTRTAHMHTLTIYHAVGPVHVHIKCFAFELAGRKQSEAIFLFADVSFLHEIFPNALLRTAKSKSRSFLLGRFERKALYALVTVLSM